MAIGYIQYGSKGGDVKVVQKLLNQHGYQLNEDGIFGNNTLAAVKDFQKKNGLTVDGIAGKDTIKLLNSYKPTTTPTTTNPPTATNNSSFKYKDFTYGDYEESDIVKQANAALQAQLAQKPGEYKSQWQTQLDDTINKILNREKFSYDLNGDALYQQYKDKFIQQGKMAMGDAIGQASAMTGGYGNSYAQSVGQQMYQKELQNLNDIVPELYQMALDKYDREGQDLYNQYAMLGDAEDKDYGRYRDEVADFMTERDYLTGRYDSERELDYSKYVDDRNFEYGKYADDKSYAYNEHRNAIEDALRREEFDYQKERDRISDEQWQKLYDAEHGTNGTVVDDTQGGNKGSIPGGGYYDNGSLDSEQIKALQKALGVKADGLYGYESKDAADGLSAEEAYKKFVGPIEEPNEPDYSDWDASDWNSYFAEIRASEGKSAAEEELNRMTKQGLIPKNMISYAATGARGKLGH